MRPGLLLLLLLGACSPPRPAPPRPGDRRAGWRARRRRVRSGRGGRARCLWSAVGERQRHLRPLPPGGAIRRAALLLLLLLLQASCGPRCPTAREWRADLR